MATLTEGERITRLETEMNHVATKADVAAVRTDIEAVRTDMQAVRTDMESVRTDMARMQTSIIKWMACMVIGIVLSVGLGIADLLVALLSRASFTHLLVCDR